MTKTVDYSGSFCFGEGKGKAHGGALPHTHYGYAHDEYGTYLGLSDKDNKKIERILKSWEKKRKTLNL